MINHTLDFMKLENGGDFISGKYFIQMSYLICTEKKSEEESDSSDGRSSGGNSKMKYVHEFIKDCKVWQNVTFWEEFFWGAS